jgi:uncharacterized protein (TIGR02600 family)
VPWQTLLFRPHAMHYGATSPPDHLLLDLFWSPVLEPEPISLGFETQGKINLNHELVPFHHIKRATALHALLKAETITAIPNSNAEAYKNGTNPDERFRHYIDINATMRVWKRRVFDNGATFLSPSQICEHPLIPEGLVPANAEPSMPELNAFWEDHQLTGDNSKERPYARLHSRLTTRSNTFRVHFIAQSLKKARSTDAATFDPTRDRVTATVRGSRIIRRSLDMKNEAIPDYLNPPANTPQPSLEQFYHWSVGTVEQ